MSGTGRRSAYRKHITEEVLNSYPEPDVEAGEQIAQVVQSRGGNILQVLCDDGDESLAILPTKYRKLIWVKRGDFVIVSSASHDFITAAGDRGKVRFMIEHILYRDQIKHLKACGLWPEVFDEACCGAMDEMPEIVAERADDAVLEDGGGQLERLEDDDDEYESSDDDMSDLPVNTNRQAKRHLVQYDDDEDDDDEDDVDEEEDGAEDGEEGRAVVVGRETDHVGTPKGVACAGPDHRLDGLSGGLAQADLR